MGTNALLAQAEAPSCQGDLLTMSLMPFKAFRRDRPQVILTLALALGVAAALGVSQSCATIARAENQAPGAAAAPEPDQTKWGKAIHGIQAGIRVKGGRNGVRVNEQVAVEIVLKNVSDQPASVAFPNAQRIYGWRVKRDRGSKWVIAPRWMFKEEEKVEMIVAGALEFTIPAGKEVALPMDSPEILIADSRGGGGKHKADELVIPARPGSKIEVRALPITAAARGEEWFEQLQTGELTLPMSAR